MSSRAVIVDGYVDEPACFGVPPYISPYVRYAAGAFERNGIRTDYTTIDEIRKDPSFFFRAEKAEYVLVIAGVSVPGKYMGGTPASATELLQIGAGLREPKKIICGPVIFGTSSGGGEAAEKQCLSVYDHVLTGETGAALDAVIRGDGDHGEFDYERIDEFAVAGAGIIEKHPLFPDVMCEIETARGCSRFVSGGCSFCTEYLYGRPVFRSAAGVHAEVNALYESGARHFRVGRQPDLLTYGASGGEYPRPVPEKVESLFKGIREAAPGLKTLHIDNINPRTIAEHPEAASEALESVVRWHTPGDVAAFGMESADPVVIAENNLKAMPDQVMTAIEIVNAIGGKREEGVPHLLPGLNFVLGLKGETPRTYELNARFLAGIMDSGMLVRRVNIRQVMPFEGTKAYEDNTLGLHDDFFRKFKAAVRKDFDKPMLKKVFPPGTVLRDVIMEVEGDVSFGRQMGSYPILTGIPLRIKRSVHLDVVVSDWGHRSITAFPFPVKINSLPLSALRQIPGLGKKRAATIVSKRPFSGPDEFREVAGATGLDDYLTFD